MNTDDLISQYIDGDLNENDDALLRMQISEKEQVKRDFDDAVSVHCALCDDAKSIELPDGLLSDTMKAINQVAGREQTIVVQLYERKREIRRMAMSIAAVLVLGFAFISDFPLLKYYSELTRYQAQEANTSQLAYNKVVKSVENPTKHSRKSSAKSQRSAFGPYYNGDLASNSEAINAENSTIERENVLLPEAEFSELALDEVTENTAPRSNIGLREGYFAASVDVTGRDNLSENRRNYHLGSFKNLENSDMYKSKYEINPDVELVTTYGGYNFNNVFDDSNDKLTIGLSQSIGYRFASKHKIGFEFGYMDYSYHEQGYKQLSGADFGSGSSVEIPTDLGSQNGSGVWVPVTKSVNERSLWASVFYEYRIFGNARVNLDAHAGIGGNSNGLMNLLRLSGNVWIVNGVKFTLGLDGRFFYTDVASGGKSTMKMRSSLDLIYGIQFDC